MPSNIWKIKTTLNDAMIELYPWTFEPSSKCIRGYIRFVSDTTSNPNWREMNDSGPFPDQNCILEIAQNVCVYRIKWDFNLFCVTRTPKRKLVLKIPVLIQFSRNWIPLQILGFGSIRVPIFLFIAILRRVFE